MTLRRQSESGPFRVYEPDECGPDGYPIAWHRGLIPVEDADGRYLEDFGTTIAWWPADGKPHPPEYGVKHIVRMEAGHRCVRCRHPFVCGETPGRYSPCDRECSHRGPVRLSYTADDGSSVTIDPHELATEAGVVVGYGKTVEAIARVLTVHHLRLGDEAKRDLRWWNLAALCQRCHLTIQGRVVMERVWPWEHSNWFKPYAAAWYAWTYLGEDLTREQTMARLDELLALESAVA